MTKTATRTRQPAGLRALSLRQTLPRTQPAFASHRAGPCSPPQPGRYRDRRRGAQRPAYRYPRPCLDGTCIVHRAGPFAMLVSGGWPVPASPLRLRIAPGRLPVPRIPTNNPLELSPQNTGRSGTPGQLRRETTPRLRYAQTPTGPYLSANQPPETPR